MIGLTDHARRTVGSIRRAHGLRGWVAEVADVRALTNRHALPHVTLLEEQNLTIDRFHTAIDLLSKKQKASKAPAFVFLRFLRLPTKNEQYQLLIRFPKPERVIISANPGHSRIREFLEELDPKIDVLQEIGADPSPLDAMEKVVAVTRNLRGPNGDLSADSIAQLYGVSLSELGKWIDRSRQGLAKAPTARSLQAKLAMLERIARLRLRFSEEDFRKWLRIENDHLGGASPLDLIKSRKSEVVADLVADMITGRPA